MSAYDQIYRFLDAKTRRKLQDERRMRFRRAIEHYDEGRLLQVELADYPDLACLSGVAAQRPVRPSAKNLQPAR